MSGLHRITVSLLAAVTLAVFGAHTASANCAAPYRYKTTVSGNTVEICPQNFSQRKCPDPGGLLREDAAGTLQRAADFCRGECYVDECVPPGDYRYGFATPFTCCESCCGTDYFGEAKVTTSLPASCARSAGNPGPTAAAAPAPWAGKQNTFCNYRGGAGNSSGAPAPVAPTDAGGCAVGGSLSSAPVVLGFNGLLVAFGALWSRRRRRGRGEG